MLPKMHSGFSIEFFSYLTKHGKSYIKLKKVKYISKYFFPVSNTNVKFWQMLKNIFVNKMAKVSVSRSV